MHRKMLIVSVLLSLLTLTAVAAITPPSLNGVSLHLEPSLGVYILHIWAWRNNPAGLFEDFNPAVPLCS
jgi:hypothetical protein